MFAITHRQPVHSLLDARALHCTARHDAPVPVPELAQPERLRDVGSTLCTRLILLVRKHQKGGIFQLILVQHGRKLVRCCLQALDIGRVDDEDDRRRIRIVASPVWPDARLSAQIPNVEVEFPVCDGLDVESDRGYRRYYFADLFFLCKLPVRVQRTTDKSHLESVEECRLAGVILRGQVFSMRGVGVGGKGKCQPAQGSESGFPSLPKGSWRPMTRSDPSCCRVVQGTRVSLLKGG